MTILARLSAFLLLLLVGLSTASAPPVLAQEPMFFRIGTGGVNGTYYPIGAIIGNAISSPPGSRACESGGSCGVSGLIAIVVSSNGAVSNIEAMERGEIDSGFAQSDVVHAAYTATGPFDGRRPMTELRVIASLYAERMQLVAAKGSGIAGLADLAGLRVSLDEPGSGTLLLATDLLQAAGIGTGGVIAEYMKPGPAASLIARGELDAFFIAAGVPTNAVAELITAGKATVVPLAGPAVDTLLDRHEFLSRAPIPAGVYGAAQPEIDTFGVTAQWVTTSKAPEDLVYGICKALWNDATRTLLDGGHPSGKQIRLESALAGVNVPLHAGAERCYADLKKDDG
ncbi:MAG: TAXI family TRAP transporter solute-binding subunit [Thalassobaculaceae bacterium]|nr:TAXI family TRAP transporter solute-binding subunit [Thalassobaculaceae bacterium]